MINMKYAQKEKIKKLGVKIVCVALAAFAVLSAIMGSVYADDSSTPKTYEMNEALEFTHGLGAGWNLGNAFDAANCTWLSDEMDYESAWCGEKTTKKLIKTVKEAGFDTVRLPASWSDHVDENFNISENWLNRYMEVADWCLDEGLYIIVNVHHDIDTDYYFPDSAHLKNSTAYMTAIWEQLCDAFKNYDNHVIFESINEPRAVGTNNEWWFDANNITDTLKDYFDSINKLNQTFVDVVRASGGNNKTRYLMVPGYATATENLLFEYFEMPSDSVKNRLIVTAHIYDINETKYTRLFDQLFDAFISKGIPVIIGEWGTTEMVLPEKRITISAQFCANAYARGLVCVLWDNNGYDNNKDSYGLINRKTCEIVYPEICEAIVKNSVFSNTSSSSKKLAAPTLKATKNGDTIKLTWNKVDDADAYRVYLYNAETKKFKRVATVKGTKKTFSDLESGVYRYKVVAVTKTDKGYVNGEFSNTIKATIK